MSSFRKGIDTFFDLGQECKNENIDVMQLSVNLMMNSLYGVQIRKEIEEKFACKPEKWMMSEYDERVNDYWKTSHGS